MYPSQGPIGIWEGLMPYVKDNYGEDTHDSEIPSTPLAQQPMPQDSVINIDNYGSQEPDSLICPTVPVPLVAR